MDVQKATDTESQLDTSWKWFYNVLDEECKALIVCSLVLNHLGTNLIKFLVVLDMYSALWIRRET